MFSLSYKFIWLLVGYRTVALNQTVHDSTIDDEKKKKQESSNKAKVVTSMIPDPIDVSKLNEKWKGKLCILNRITFICSNSSKAHRLVQFYVIKLVFEPFILKVEFSQVLKYLI